MRVKIITGLIMCLLPLSIYAKSTLTVELIQPVQKEEVKVKELDINGKINPLEEVSIKTNSTQVVTKVNVAENTFIMKGQVLVEYDTKLLKLDIDSSNATIEEAQANLNILEDKLNRMKSVEKTGAIPAVEITQLELQINALKAKIKANKSNIDLKKEMLERSQVRSPLYGTIIEKNVTEGSNTTDGQVIFKVHRENILEFKASVANKDLGDFKVGNDINLEINKVSTKGKITKINKDDANNSSVVIELSANAYKSLKNEKNSVSAKLKKITQPVNKPTMLPLSSVVNKDGEVFIGTVKDSIVTLTKVKTGKIVDGKIEVLSEINLPIVKDGVSFLNSGDTVTVK